MLKYIANQDVIFHNKMEDVKEEKQIRALWRAVITQALMDASSLSHKSFNKAEKMRARAWLEGDSEDFFTVCSLADMDPGYVKAKAAEAILRNCKWRRGECDKIKKYHKDHYLHDNIYYGKQMIS